MEEQEFEFKLKNYLKNHLTINAKIVEGSYGSPSYIQIELALDETVISETYIDVDECR